LTLFALGQIIDIRQKVPKVFKMETVRSLACLNETENVTEDVTEYPWHIRLLTLSPNFIGILSLILFFIVGRIGKYYAI